VALVAVLLVLNWIMPIFSLPKPTGNNLVGTRTAHWTDPQTNRELVVQMWYPAQANDLPRARYVRAKEVKWRFRHWTLVRTNSAQHAPALAGAHPLVVFGPMWGGRRTQDTFLAEELASHGYIVAAVDHPGNAGRVQMSDGRVVTSTMAGALSDVETSGAAAIEALWAKELAVWVRDDEYAMDQLAAADWVSVDWSRVGALGHSFGGSASMALLGADKRVKCAVNLDGWTFDGIAKRTTEPVLFVYEGSAEERGRNTGAEARLDAADNAAVDGSLARFGGLRAYVAGTQHLDFTDQTMVSPLQRLTYTGPIKGERVRTILRGMIVGFFDRTLKGSGEIPEFPEVKMEVHPPPRVLGQSLQE
jgi:dienelactone hydrolase